MGKLKDTLEKIAVDYSLSENKEEKRKQNKRVFTLLRRVYHNKPKKVVKGIKYYRTARKQSDIVKVNLVNFVDTYNELTKENNIAKAANCEKKALDFIKSIFYNNKDAIAKLTHYYLELKHPQAGY